MKISLHNFLANPNVFDQTGCVWCLKFVSLVVMIMKLA